MRKLQRKNPCWNVFVSKIKKNILSRMFSWKFSRIFQNNQFVEHLRLATFLIPKVFWLNDSYLFLFWTLTCFLRISHLGQGYSSIALRLRIQTSLFIVFTEKNICLFGRELLLRKRLIQSINEFLENRNQNPLNTRYFSAIFH